MNRLTLLLVAAFWGCQSIPATAGLIYSTNQGTFVNQGIISQTTNFDDFGPGLHYEGGDFTRGSITLFESTPNFYFIGAGSAAGNGVTWNPDQDVTLNPFGPTSYGEIASSPTPFTMFAFEAGYLTYSSDHSPNGATITITTNLATYNFSDTIPEAENSLTFEGFATDNPSEYFQDFSITSSTGTFCGVTDMELGVAFVPEPGSMTLLGLALIGLVLFRRQSRLAPKAL